MQYYVAKNGQQLGPFTVMDVRQRLQSGELAYTDLAWREGIPDWTPLTDLMGGALPEATPHAVAAPDRSTPGAGAEVPTGARIATAAVIFIVFFVSIFVLVSMIVMTIGVAMNVAHAVAAQHVQNSTDGRAVGQQVGRQFGETYGGMIGAGSALFAFVVAGLAAWKMGFSNLFPWCRANSTR